MTNEFVYKQCNKQILRIIYMLNKILYKYIRIKSIHLIQFSIINFQKMDCI
jgi:hypothetical protein